MEEDNNSRDKVEDEEAEADAVEGMDGMDEVAKVDATTLDKETTTNKQQLYHQPNQPHRQETSPLL